jgi:Ca-activated chloride channel homolog
MPQLPDIHFVWPHLLWWLLLIVPVAAFLYGFSRGRGVWGLTGWLSTALMTMGLACLLLAIARPQMKIDLPTRADRLMVVLDTSGSMRADDVSPERFSLAKSTVQALIEQQPAAMQVGLVTTAATATVNQAPTTDREALLGALDTVNLQTGSALGSGLLIGLSELLPSAGIDVQALMNDSMQRRQPDDAPSWSLDPKLVKPAGSNRSVAMLLISDGESNMGPDVMQMAELAAQLGVRIYTVGVGTTDGAVVKAEGVSQRVRLEPAVLQDIAQITMGTYYEGATKEELTEIFNAIEASIAFDKRQTFEVSAILLLLGLLLVLLGMGISFWRLGRIA